MKSQHCSSACARRAPRPNPSGELSPVEPLEPRLDRGQQRRDLPDVGVPGAATHSGGQLLERELAHVAQLVRAEPSEVGETSEAVLVATVRAAADGAAVANGDARRGRARRLSACAPLAVADVDSGGYAGVAPCWLHPLRPARPTCRERRCRAKPTAGLEPATPSLRGSSPTSLR